MYTQCTIFCIIERFLCHAIQHSRSYMNRWAHNLENEGIYFLPILHVVTRLGELSTSCHPQLCILPKYLPLDRHLRASYSHHGPWQTSSLRCRRGAVIDSRCWGSAVERFHVSSSAFDYACSLVTNCSILFGSRHECNLDLKQRLYQIPPYVRSQTAFWALENPSSTWCRQQQWTVRILRRIRRAELEIWRNGERWPGQDCGLPVRGFSWIDQPCAPAHHRRIIGIDLYNIERRSYLLPVIG